MPILDTVLKNISLQVNAGEKVDLNTGFRANMKDRTYFRARIKQCSVLKSDIDSLPNLAEGLNDSLISSLPANLGLQPKLLN